MNWNEKASMSEDLPEGSSVGFDLTNIDLSGPSPSFLATIVFSDQTVLVAKDMDPRKLSDGSYRITREAYKMSFGWGGTMDTLFDDQSPVSQSLYGCTACIRDHLSYLGYYISRGEGWGPAVIVAYSCPENLKEQFLRDLNHTADGRFVDFCTLPLSKMVESGHDHGAVYDAQKLTYITHDNKQYKMWDEAQPRKYLLSLILNTQV
jgi:hypothetical protein